MMTSLLSTMTSLLSTMTSSLSTMTSSLSMVTSLLSFLKGAMVTYTSLETWEPTFQGKITEFVTMVVGGGGIAV